MRSLRGVSLMDVVVGTALALVVFVGLFGILRASLQIAGLSKLKATATELASSQIEYVRSLEYADIGTLGGIPAGTIPQQATVTSSGINYDVRTYIQYADDPKDGSGASDSNHITTDYKRVKVTVEYVVNGVTRDVTLITTAAPPGIESTTGGGTLQISVVNAVGAPVSGADVRIRNSATSPAIDLTTFTDTLGVVFLPGAPTSTEYRILVEKDGYSSAQTYARDATNQNPTPGYFTVVGGSTTSGTFAIDLLADLVIRTFSPIRAALWSDTFADSSKLTETSGVTVGGEAVSLTLGGEGYVAFGTAESVAAAPQYLASWTSASSTATVPVGTGFEFSILDGTGNLVPEGVLPGNSAGFTGAVDLSGVSTTTYPALALAGTLTTSNTAATPSLLSWAIGYDEGPVPLPNVSLELAGGKTVGSTGVGAPLLKTEIATSTGAAGILELSLEWDSYAFSIPGYTVLSSPELPLEVLPGASVEADLILE